MDDTNNPIRFLPPNEILLERFLSGECSPEEMQHVRAWSGRTRDGEILADVVRETLHDPGIPVEAPERMRDAVWAQVQLTESEGHSKKRWWQESVFRYSFIATSCLIAIAWGFQSFNGRPVSFQTGTQTRSYTTGVGQLAQVQIADGSRFLLAPKSSLTLIEDAAHGVRRAILTGEARFEVIPNSRVPFEVHNGQVVTRVLGTTFDVRRYQGDPAGHIAVISGKVATSVTGRGTPLTLTAGMVAQFTDSLITATTIRDSTSYIDWTSGRLIFRDVPIPIVLETLSRWYEYKFQVVDSTILEQHVTATFMFGETTEMLRLLQRVLGVGMTVRDSTVILRSASDGANLKAPVRYKMPKPFPILTEVGR